MSDAFSRSCGPSLPTFSANPYQSDGGCSATGLAILAVVTAVAGAVVGAMAGFLAQWFFLIVLFPLGMGFLIGIAGSMGIRMAKVRMPLICGLGGFLAGCLAVVAMHGFEYHTFNKQLGDVPDGVRLIAKNLEQIRAKRDELPKELQELVDDLGKDPAAREALSVSSLAEFVDFQARQGVTLTKAGRGGKGVNLGYVGSYIYWGVELLLIAGVAFVVMRGAANEPFCSQCENWKTSELLGSCGGSTVKLQEALESGDLPALANDMGAEGTIVASLFQCPQCGAAAPVDVRLEQVTVNAKGETSKSTLCTVTYPGEAAAPLRQVFSASSATHVADASEPTASEADSPGDASA